MIQYDRICERYTMPGHGEEVIALIELTPCNNYMIQYNPYTTPCSCGPFSSILDAQNTIKRHRPTSVLMETKTARYDIIRLGKETCRIAPVNRADKELLEIAGGGGVIGDMETLLDIIDHITKECDRLGYEYQIR